MADNFTYSPLRSEDQEIRLLRLHPASSTTGDDIQCDLFTASLADGDLRYDALSYCWGDPKPRKNVYINGQGVGTGPELEAALRHFRDTMPGLVIWADAICINQRDDRERSEQVRQMGAIYGKAQHVQVWLGVPSEGIRIPPLEVMEDEPELDLLQWLEEDAPVLVTSGSDLQGSAFFDFITRPYWNRLWIVQELALSQEAVIYYGGRKIGVKAEWLGRKIGRVYQLIMSRNKGKTLYQWHLRSILPDPGGMLDVLESLSTLRARLNDYGKTVEEVYLDFARFAVKNHHDTYMLLRLSGLQSDRPGVLPSWTPDWRQVCHGSKGFYKGPWRRSKKVHGNCDDRIGLHIQARQRDEVQEVLTVPALFNTQPETLSQQRSAHDVFVEQFLSTHPDQDNKQSRLKSLFNLVTRRHGSEPLQPWTNEHREESAAFVHMLIKPMSTLELPADVHGSYIHRIGTELLYGGISVRQVEQLQAGDHTQAPLLEFHTQASLREFEPDIIRDVSGSRLFMTRSGEMGFGSPKIRPGDGVYSLKPDGALFAFRKEGSGDGEEWYSNAGECYVPSLARSTKGGSDEREYIDIEIR
ncbi:hypothetical protein PRZ48_014341 [Zasmidium cellare]|uniref:Heterokaryon incompatibility domain-containing protein n=1 Tax=Zasmidium cellare TaxID=395010 RepID=A0ABR0E0P0_ZASCE|nr:hypothetical protein PRZ48_015290 [Zasmidium cellare]KAK4494985.1 hypothetical protein PRZ48_014341 [Zasmidium cellare]